MRGDAALPGPLVVVAAHALTAQATAPQHESVLPSARVGAWPVPRTPRRGGVPHATYATVVKERQLRAFPFLGRPAEVYRTLPVREELLRAVLGADLIGCQTYDFARHFISSCTRILGLEVRGAQVPVCWHLCFAWTPWAHRSDV